MHPPCCRAWPNNMSLKSIPLGGRAMRTCRPSRLHLYAQSCAAASPGSSPSASTITSRTSRCRFEGAQPGGREGSPRWVALCLHRGELFQFPHRPSRGRPNGRRPSALRRHGKGRSIIFDGLTAAFPLPSWVMYVLWTASGAPSQPRITKATMVGQLPPDGCFKLPLKRKVSDGGSRSFLLAKYLSTAVPAADVDACQSASALSRRPTSSLLSQLPTPAGSRTSGVVHYLHPSTNQTSA